MYGMRYYIRHMISSTVELGLRHLILFFLVVFIHFSLLFCYTFWLQFCFLFFSYFSCNFFLILFYSFLLFNFFILFFRHSFLFNWVLTNPGRFQMEFSKLDFDSTTNGNHYLVHAVRTYEVVMRKVW
jgi:hypothetical protein